MQLLKLESIQALEAARLELEKIKKTIGSGSDYLDRGRSSAEERVVIEAAIRNHKVEAHTLEHAFNRLLDDYRHENPDYLNAWVNIHVDILNEIITEISTLSVLSIQHKTYLHVATKTLKAWQAVLADKRTYVAINTSILTDYYQRLSEKLATIG